MTPTVESIALGLDEGSVGEITRDQVELLIHHGDDVNKLYGHGFNALHKAARNGDIDVVNFLLENGADADKLTACKNTPLALAAFGSHLDCLNILLKQKVNVDSANESKDTPMHYLAEYGNVEGIQALLDHGANPDLLNDSHASPLWNAIHNRSLKAVRILVMQNVSLEVKSDGREYIAVDDTIDRVGSGSTIYCTISLYSKPRSLLWVAVKREWMDAVTLLLQAGYNIWKEGWLLSGDDQDLSEKSRAISQHLRALAQKPPALRLLCRSTIRKAVTFDLETAVHQFPIAAILKDYLLLKDLNLQGDRLRVSLWDFTYDS